MSSLLGGEGPKVDDMMSKLNDMKSVIHKVSQRFKHANETTFVCVCIPEFLSVYETERLVQQLGKYGINVNSIVINQVVVFEKSSSRLYSLIKSVLVVNVLLVVRCRINILTKFSIYSKISIFFLFLN